VNISECLALQIEIFDATGQEVHTQSTGKLQPGKHHLRIELQGLSAGMYHYTVSSGQRQASGKLMIR